MQKLSKQQKTNSYTEKLQTNNNNNSPSSLCEVKWYNYSI